VRLEELERRPREGRRRPRRRLGMGRRSG